MPVECRAQAQSPTSSETFSWGGPGTRGRSMSCTKQPRRRSGRPITRPSSARYRRWSGTGPFGASTSGTARPITRWATITTNTFAATRAARSPRCRAASWRTRPPGCRPAPAIRSRATISFSPGCARLAQGTEKVPGNSESSPSEPPARTATMASRRDASQKLFRRMDDRADGLTALPARPPFLGTVIAAWCERLGALPRVTYHRSVRTTEDSLNDEWPR